MVVSIQRVASLRCIKAACGVLKGEVTMFRSSVLCLVLGVAAFGTPVRGAVVWDGLDGASLRAQATAQGDDQFDSDQDSEIYPTDALPLTVSASARVDLVDGGGASADAAGRNNGVRIELTEEAMAWGNPITATSDGTVWGWIVKKFHVVGGTGPVAVSIPLRVWGDLVGEYSFATWEAEVVGEPGLVSGGHQGPPSGGLNVNEQHAWVGTLNYGQSYQFRYRVEADGEPGDADSDMSYNIELLLPPFGACCLPTGRCVVQTEGECFEDGGTYEGDGMSCDPNPCPQPTRIEERSWGRIKSEYR
jgi:hypothetical protein